MAFKFTLLVCGLVLSVQHAYSQALGYGFGGGYANSFGSSYGGASAAAAAEADVSVVDVDAIRLGSAYGNGFAAGNAGWGSAGLGWTDASATAAGWAGAGSAGAGLAGTGLASAGLASAGSIGAGWTGTGLASAGSAASLAGANSASVAAVPVYLNLNSLSSGGVLPVTSFGSIVPVGISIVSDNTIEGPVSLTGQLPFLSAVAFEGALASGGSGLAECGCGAAGNIGIISESVGPTAGASALGLGLAGVAAPGRLLY